MDDNDGDSDANNGQWFWWHWIWWWWWYVNDNNVVNDIKNCCDDGDGNDDCEGDEDDEGISLLMYDNLSSFNFNYPFTAKPHCIP